MIKEVERSEEKRGEVDENEGISEEDIKEEVREIMKNVKGKKAARADGIPNEAWKYGGERTIEAITRSIIKDIWKEKYFPREWRSGIVKRHTQERR